MASKKLEKELKKLYYKKSIRFTQQSEDFFLWQRIDLNTLPSWKSKKTEKLHLNILVVDQGWGNIKGSLHFYKGLAEDIPILELFHNIWVTHDATHHSIEVENNECEVIHILYKVGGGGGHSLSIQNLSIDP
eukprot:snap_masked-scaffold_2-processed-gene-14.15-mRNA-1 protein AED:0.16 eAED:1.00 QI:0/-1/0/1/-1/1/1/0/131